jgi:hypothetical protein
MLGDDGAAQRLPKSFTELLLQRKKKNTLSVKTVERQQMCCT